MNARPNYYHLSTWLENVEVCVTVNGFPIVEEVCPLQSSTTAPLNHVLCGARNEIEWRLAGLSGAGPVRNQLARLGVHRYFAGETADSAGGPPDRALVTWNLASWAEERKEAKETADLPMTGRAIFASPGTDCFSALLGECEPVAPAECLAYARLLRALFARRDVDAICDEFAPRVAGYACAHGQPLDVMSARFAALIREFLQRELAGEPTEELFEMTRWCDDKLVRIRRPRGDELLIGVDTKDGSEMSIDVFLAKVAGRMRVVR